jgi:hypothetical protein
MDINGMRQSDFSKGRRSAKKYSWRELLELERNSIPAVMGQKMRV